MRILPNELYGLIQQIRYLIQINWIISMMSIQYFLLILIFINGSVSQSVHKAYYSSRPVDRTSANTECNVFGRDLSGQINKFKLQTDAPTDKLVWISARSEYSEWFSYKGCYLIGHAVNTSTTSNSVSFCSTFCNGYLSFALGENVCYCLPELPVQKSSSCKQRACTGDKTDYCGSDMSALVYQRISIFGDGGNCVAMTTYYDLVYYSTDNCSDRYGFICKNFDGTYIYYPELSTWTEAVRKCYERGRTISDTYQLLGDKTTLPDGVPAWVGIFRKEVFFWNNGNTSSSCVAGSIDAEREITLVTTNCEKELPVLCHDDIKGNATSNKQLETLKDLTFIIIGNAAIGVMILFIIILFCSYRCCGKKKHTSKKQKLENEDTSDFEDFEERVENVNASSMSTNRNNKSNNTADASASSDSNTAHETEINKNYNILEVPDNTAVQRRPPRFRVLKERLSSYYNSLVLGKRKKKRTSSFIDVYDHVELNTNPYSATSDKTEITRQRNAVAELYDHVTENEMKRKTVTQQLVEKVYYNELTNTSNRQTNTEQPQYTNNVVDIEPVYYAIAETT